MALAEGLGRQRELAIDMGWFRRAKSDVTPVTVAQASTLYRIRGRETVASGSFRMRRPHRLRNDRFPIARQNFDRAFVEFARASKTWSLADD
jgi:hypothetical protein